MSAISAPRDVMKERMTPNLWGVTMIKWPRGRYNGKRIGGLELKIEINFAWWIWAIYWKSYSPVSFHAGPIHIWITAAYEKR
jgi:hypothetical protein